MNAPMPDTVLVTGSAGLIGSMIARYFYAKGCDVYGIDNNLRSKFFGIGGDTTPTLNALQSDLPNYIHADIDLRNFDRVRDLIKKVKPDLIVHCAAQPSHDLAASIPIEDFDVNAVATVHLLESVRKFVPETVLVYMSTNKVYGDKPNTLPLVERKTRWDYADPEYFDGISEDFGIDQSTHSLFGASKLTADIYVQEYGRYFGLNTCCLRGGCLTGAGQRGVQLHGFLSYLVRTAAAGEEYTIFGYLGKQVRDNIHAEDVAKFIEQFYRSPKKGEVYNIGGGRGNSCSILEAMSLIEKITGQKVDFQYLEQPRIGDHICYITDLRKARRDYPDWDVRWRLEDIIGELWQYWSAQFA